jgi:hypothetical protein
MKKIFISILVILFVINFLPVNNTFARGPKQKSRIFFLNDDLNDYSPGVWTQEEQSKRIKKQSERIDDTTRLFLEASGRIPDSTFEMCSGYYEKKYPEIGWSYYAPFILGVVALIFFLFSRILVFIKTYRKK